MTLILSNVSKVLYSDVCVHVCVYEFGNKFLWRLFLTILAPQDKLYIQSRLWNGLTLYIL